MKKTIIGIILFVVVTALAVFGVLIYEKNNEETIPDEVNNPEEKINEELLKCLNNELGAHILSEQDDLVEIPLSDIIDTDENIVYYSGYYASNNPDNKYVLTVWKNKTYSSDTNKYFEEYFYKNYDVYQTYDISSEGISIYIHNSFNDVNYNEIINRCVEKNMPEVRETMPDGITEKIKDTKEIIVKKSNDDYLGVIEDAETINKIIDIIASGKQYGDVGMCDYHTLELALRSADNEVIDTIKLWSSGNRLMPESISSGCSYYITDDDLREIIEDKTDYRFYGIMHNSAETEDDYIPIYSDNNYTYYLSHLNKDDILIRFTLTNQTMSLEYALQNGYILASQVADEYPDILKRERNN